MARKHTLTITLFNKSSDFSFIVLRYRGEKKYEKVIHQNIEVKHWDNIRNNIKQSKQRNYPELVNLIEGYKSKFPKYIDELNKGDIHPSNVLDAILGKHKDKSQIKTVREFIETYKGDGTKNYLKFKSNIGGIESNLKASKFKIKELEVGMLSDESIVKGIAKVFRESPSVGNVAIEYMKTLDRISRDANLKKNSLFKDLNLVPKKEVTHKEAVTTTDLQMGIAKIKTYKQLEAYLFWLYSYCLSGLDGGDIVDLDESCLMGLKDKKLSHYHYLGDFIDSIDPNIDFSHKVRYFKPRNKEKNVPRAGVFNMFPTLFIRDWLYYLIKINRPELCYKGEDRIRLFNFKINDGKVENDKGLKKWIQLRGIYRDQMQKMFGASLQFARHTVAQTSRQESNTSSEDVDLLIGHKTRGVNKNYLDGGKVSRIDVLQMKNIEDFDILGTLTLLYKSLRIRMGKKNKLYSLDSGFDSNKNKPFKAWNDNLILGFGLLGFEKKKINWTLKDEIEYQSVQNELMKEIISLDDLGMPVKRKNNIEDLSEDSKVILNRKKEIFNIQTKVKMGVVNGKVKIVDAQPMKHSVEISKDVEELLKKE